MQLSVQVVEAKMPSMGFLRKPPSLYTLLRWRIRGGEEEDDDDEEEEGTEGQSTEDSNTLASINDGGGSSSINQNSLKQPIGTEGDISSNIPPVVEKKTEVIQQSLNPKWKDANPVLDESGPFGTLEVEMTDAITHAILASAEISLDSLLKDRDVAGTSSAWFSLEHEGKSNGKIWLVSSLCWDDELDNSSGDDCEDERDSGVYTTAAAASVGQTKVGSAMCRTRYRIGDSIGRGAFGKVFLGMNVATGELLAVKQIELSRLAPNEVSALEQELVVLRELRHAHIVSYIDTDVGLEAINILMEYCPGGSLAKLLRIFGAFEEDTIRAYTRQILEGLVFLHSNRIVHRDIKGANILVAHNCLKIGDFGASTRLLGTSTMVEDRGVQGTPFWMAPEVILQKEYGRKADVWSVGMTVVEMAMGAHPWQKLGNTFTVMYEIANGDSLPEIPSSLSPACKDFIHLCLKRDPAARPSSAELLNHPFIKAT